MVSLHTQKDGQLDRQTDRQRQYGRQTGSSWISMCSVEFVISVGLFPELESHLVVCWLQLSQVYHHNNRWKKKSEWVLEISGSCLAWELCADLYRIINIQFCMECLICSWQEQSGQLSVWRCQNLLWCNWHSSFICQLFAQIHFFSVYLSEFLLVYYRVIAEIVKIHIFEEYRMSQMCRKGSLQVYSGTSDGWIQILLLFSHSTSGMLNSHA